MWLSLNRENLGFLTSSFSSTYPAAASTRGDVSPTARLASIEKTSPSDRNREREKSGNLMDMVEGFEMGQFPRILSPAPATLPPIQPGFLSLGGLASAAGTGRIQLTQYQTLITQYQSQTKVIASLSHMQCPNCKNDFQIFKSMLVDELQLCPYCIQPFSAAVGQQNSIPDMQQQQQRLLSQQNNLSNQQQQSQQQMMSNLLPSQGQQSQQQSQQQMMLQIQSQLGQLQQQLGMQQQQPNPLQRDMQQGLQTPGTLLQQQNVIDQQKQLFQSQRVIILEASSRGLCCCDVVRRYCCDVAGDLSFIFKQLIFRNKNNFLKRPILRKTTYIKELQFYDFLLSSTC